MWHPLTAHTDEVYLNWLVGRLCFMTALVSTDGPAFDGADLTLDKASKFVYNMRGYEPNA